MFALCCACACCGCKLTHYTHTHNSYIQNSTLIKCACKNRKRDTKSSIDAQPICRPALSPQVAIDESEVKSQNKNREKDKKKKYITSILLSSILNVVEHSYCLNCRVTLHRSHELPLNENNNVRERFFFLSFFHRLWSKRENNDSEHYSWIRLALLCQRKYVLIICTVTEYTNVSNCIFVACCTRSTFVPFKE